MPRRKPGVELGKRMLLAPNWSIHPTYPARMEIYCPLHVPRSPNRPEEQWSPVHAEEAQAKALVCFSCLKMLGTGSSVSTLLQLFFREFGAEFDLALRVRSWSWVVAQGLSEWIAATATPPDLWVYTRLLLLEQMHEHHRMPVHVALEVEVRHGPERDFTTTRFLGSSGSFPGLRDLMLFSGCDAWGPLKPARRRTLFAGIAPDPRSSANLVEALRASYGPFSLEWLFLADYL